ncbi:uncharacterized protein HaLaN_27365, partial [Haematococcus lacustris]
VSGAGEVGGVRWQLQWQQVPGLHLPAEQLRARITLLAQRMLQLEELLEAEEEAQQQVQQQQEQQLVEGQCQQQQVQQGACNIKLPDSLLNSVVVLDAPNPAAPGGVTKVYLLAMSHVSKV